MKIISGGQTGADQGGLFGASDLGIETGGCAPKGWRTEAGPAPWLAKYGLVEDISEGYEHRTVVNVRSANATVIFGKPESAGSRLTLRSCGRQGKPYLINPSAIELKLWVVEFGYECLNIAGNRESVNPGITEQVRAIIVEAFG